MSIDRGIKEAGEELERQVVGSEAMPDVMRRIKRRPIRTALRYAEVALVSAIVLAGLALPIRALLPAGDGKAGGSAGAFVQADLPFASIRYPSDWYLQVEQPRLEQGSSYGDGFSLMSFDPQMMPPTCTKSEFPAGVELFVQRGTTDWGPVPETQWPATLTASDLDDLCPVTSAEKFLAKWTLPDGEHYWALAIVGPDTPASERRALFDTFASMRFPDSGYSPWPLPDAGSLVWVAGGAEGPLGPWTLTWASAPSSALGQSGPRTLDYASGTGVVALEQLADLKGFSSVSLEQGAPVFGIVGRDVSSVALVMDDGEVVQGQMFPQRDSRSGGRSVFVVPVTDASQVIGSLVARDVYGDEVDRLQVGSGA